MTKLTPLKSNRVSKI